MMPKTWWVRTGEIRWACASVRCRIRREPEAVMICCSLVPANWPRIAWCTAVGGWMVKEYMNRFEVVAMLEDAVGLAASSRSQI